MPPSHCATKSVMPLSQINRELKKQHKLLMEAFKDLKKRYAKLNLKYDNLCIGFCKSIMAKKTTGNPYILLL